jgi:hypothetical protein
VNRCTGAVKIFCGADTIYSIQNSYLTKVKNQPTVNRKLTKASAGRHLARKKGKTMDIMVTAIVAVIISIIAVFIAVIKRRTIGKIFVYAAIGLIIGLPLGYFLTPIIISFF